MFQGCQFSDFSLISDFFENKGNRHTIDQIWSKHGQSQIVSRDRLESGKGLDNPALNTVSKH